ncbi:MAG TPA: hypothetical protein VGI20_04635 [Rhizomicrobium sp.]
MVLVGGVVPGAQPPGEIADGAQFEIGTGGAPCVELGGVAGGAFGGVMAVAPVEGIACGVFAGVLVEGVPGAAGVTPAVWALATNVASSAHVTANPAMARKAPRWR